jgi:hypothetical protein
VVAPRPPSSRLVASAVYVPRAPHETVLYALVQEHLATFLDHAARSYAAPLPRYVIDAFEGYLACGDLARGFLRCHCDGCGHDVLAAFSCKRRGLCPSCGARRMCAEAAQIVDRILPNAPLRQWVLSLPRELRGLAAMKADVFGAVERIFAEEIARATKRLAGAFGAETGSVAFEQRFGSSLNLHTHIHTLAVDGVFEKTGDGTVRVHEAPPPSNADVVDVAERVRDRTLRWLRRRGYLDERAAEDRSNAPADPSALEGCAQLALAGGAFLAKPFESRQATDADLEWRERRSSATCDGFDVHCAVRIAAGDAAGRERLVRYCARPPFALDRISVLRDGRIAYLLKVPRKGRTHRVMTPMEFMARLCALIPPPRIPAIRYHGVFASRSSWRPLVTPEPPQPTSKPKHGDAATPPAPASSASEPPAEAPPAPSAPAPPAPPSATVALPPAAPSAMVTLSMPPQHAAPPACAAPVVHVDPTTINVEHWGRLLDGELLASSRHIDWAVLMKRTFGFDVLTCPRCSTRMRLMATITDATTIRKILEHLQVRADPLPRAPARDPTWEQTDLGFEAA